MNRLRISLVSWVAACALAAGCGGASSTTPSATPAEVSSTENDDAFSCQAPRGGPGTLAEAIAAAEKRDFPGASCRARAVELLSQMTLAEKIGQMTQPDVGEVRDRTQIASRALGSVLCGGDTDPPRNDVMSWARMSQELHRASLDHRLKIPVLFGVDAVHGHNNVEGTVIFPHNIGLGAARDPDLMRRIGEITAKEVRATGVDWTFAPVLAAARDERWGRTYEAFGETTELANLLAPPFIQGLQGERLGGSESVLACAKHFVGDGGTRGGVDQGDSHLQGEEELSSLLETYQRAIDVNVGSVMVSFSAVDSVRMHCNGPLLTDALKRRMGFSGFAVSDWRAVDKLPGDDYATKLERAIVAGLDMVMHPLDFEGFDDVLASLVPGRVPQSRIDDAVFRILSVKCETGLFDEARFRLDRSGQPALAGELIAEVGSEAHRAVAREAVRKSVVVLKNDGVLPLNKAQGHIHVAGKSADDVGLQCGGWTITWQGQAGPITQGTTIRQGLEQGAAGATLSYSKDGTNARGVAVVAIGERPYAEGHGDDATLALAPEDVAAVQAARATADKVVVVLVVGRPLVLAPILELADAIVVAWLPGSEGGGVADVLYGDFSPTGTLPHSWPRDLSQVPINVGDARYDPLFSYGFGLKYEAATSDPSATTCLPKAAARPAEECAEPAAR